MPSLDRVRKLCTNEKLKSEMKAAASPPKKEATPASLRSAAPSKGRGSRGYSLLPLEGGTPKGRRLDGESGISVSQPSPRGEGYDTRMPLSPHRQSKYTHMWKKNNDWQSLPRVGKVAKRGCRFSRYNAFPHGEGKEEAASPLKKEANPASLRSTAPSKGRGSRGYSLLPVEGGAPKGRRLAWVIPDQGHEILDV